ncbi:MAG: hypothetical protein CME17_07980 [Gemmatimonadetes bacterium]|nr:hypothetical protein [Gemmatimonadota bacterium]
MKLKDSLRADAKNNIVSVALTTIMGLGMSGWAFSELYSDYENLNSFQLLLFVLSGIIGLISLVYLMLLVRHRLYSDD